MLNLGVAYRDGKGETQDYAKAREWFEKAAEKGYANAISDLERLSVREAAGAGRFTEALQLQEAFAVKTEEVETKREGKAAKETAQALHTVGMVRPVGTRIHQSVERLRARARAPS
jgi:TPR repeat protein